jgi:hypothetical protein
MNVRESFVEQAENCDALGSPFTAGLLRLLAENLSDDTPIGAKVFNWPRDPSYRTDAVGLRLVGALHALVLQGACPELGAVYPPNTATPAQLWHGVQAGFQHHRAHILDWLDLPPQTNEVRRSVALIPACLSLQDHFGLPLVLSELGASAGLNLNWDRFRLTLNGTGYGNAGSPVHLTPDWNGPLPVQLAPDVIDKAGCDLNPLDPACDALRLLAYIWPDQDARLDRTRAAIDIAAQNPAPVARADAKDWLQKRLAVRHPGAVHVIYHTIAWQYFPPAVQQSCADLIQAAGQAATPDAPIARVSMEADDTPDSACIQVTFWPGGKTQTLGRVDFHGRWVNWAGFSA